MGLFSKKDCPVCGNPVKGIGTIKIQDGTLCSDCSKKVKMDYSMLKFQTADNIKEHFEYMNENAKLYDNFTPSREYEINGFIFQVDEEHKLFFYKMKHTHETPFVYRFDEVIDYEVIEDGDTITKGGVGSAIAGGALFGGAGAVVGGVTGKKKSKTVMKTLDIKVSLKNKYRKHLTISFVPSLIEFKSGSIQYNTAHTQASQVASVFDDIIASCNNSTVAPAPASAADEILKYKNLLDSGVITQEEFEQKKKQLLDL